MGEVPFNLPSISGDVLLSFSKYPPESVGYPHSYLVKVLTSPQVALRAGSVTALTLSHGSSVQRTSPSSNAGTTPELATIPADALTFSNVAGSGSTLRAWCRIDTSGLIYWYLMVVGPGASDGAAKQFAFNTTLTLGVTTGNVLNDDDDEVILRGGEFTFPVQMVVMDRDLPFSVGNTFREFVVGEDVDLKFSMSAPQCYVFERIGCGYGCGFPESDIGGKIISPDGYESGLQAQTYEETDSQTDESYTAGVRIYGKALRPGLYLAHVWSQSRAVSPVSAGISASRTTEFPAGEISELIIISIRERSPLPGDPVLLLPHDINTVPSEYLDVIHADVDIKWAEFIRECDAYTKLPIPRSWDYSSSLWNDSRPGGGSIDTSRDDLTAMLGEFLGGEEYVSDWLNNADSAVYPSGHVHFPGFWYRVHDRYTTQYPTHIYTWYVICRDHLDDDPAETRGVWRLYCASDVAADQMAWHVVAEAPEIGLLNEYVEDNGDLVASRIEVPPKYWGSPSYLCIKGSERFVIKDNGVFAHAGYLEVELPLPEDAAEDAEPEIVTVEVFQQEPVYTLQHDGWRDLDFWPDEFTNADGKLLYKHPTLGWVMVEDIDDEPTAQDAVSPVSITHIGVPYAPAAPPMVVGNNPNAIRRDIMFAGGVGISISNIDQKGPWHGAPMVLLGNMAASGMFNGGIIWPHYPLARMVNFERLRIKITATVKATLLGSPVGVDMNDETDSGWSSYADGTPSRPSTPDNFPNWGHGKQFYSHHSSCSAQGSCFATLELNDVPCWYNGYVLFAEVRDIAASLSGGDQNDDSFDNSIAFKSGSHSVSRSESDNFHYIYPGQDEHIAPGWYRTGGIREDLEEWNDVKTGTLAANRCQMTVWMRGVIGHGREMNLCPAKITGSDRPSEQIVFTGEMGVGATWFFVGNCKYQQVKWDKYDKRQWYGAEWDDGHWDSFPTPDDSPLEDSTVNISYSVSRSWTAGLQVWKLKNAADLDNANILHGEYAGAHKSYRQSGLCSYVLNDGGADEVRDEFYSSGRCECNCGGGNVSGRTVYDDITPGIRTIYPILYYGGNASCLITTDGQSVEYHYPDANTAAPNAADALATYDDYVEMVKSCSADTPIVADWRDDGLPVETHFAGSFGGDHREEDIELTIEIQEN